MSSGCGSDRAYVKQGSQRKLVFANKITNRYGWLFLCPACSTQVYHSRGHRYKAASFNHMPSTPQAVKDACPIYSGAQSSTEYGDGYSRGGELTLALEVTRSKSPPAWRLFLRLPGTEGISEGVIVRTSLSTTRPVMLNGSEPHRDVDIVPRRTLYSVTGGIYPRRLTRPQFDVRSIDAFVFPVRHAERSARSTRLFWGFPYYVLTERRLGISPELNPLEVQPFMSTAEYYSWRCVRVTLPQNPDEAVAEWFEKRARATIDLAPYEVRLLFASPGPNRLAKTFGRNRYVAVFSNDARDVDRWLAVGDSPTHHTICEIDARISIADIEAGDQCAVGIASEEDDESWPLSLLLRREPWIEPVLNKATFSSDGILVSCALGGTESIKMLQCMRDGDCRLREVSPAGIAVDVAHKRFDEHTWVSESFDLSKDRACKKFVETANALFPSHAIDVNLTVKGVASLYVPSRCHHAITSTDKVEQKVSPWALYAARVRQLHKAQAYDYRKPWGAHP